MFSRRAARCRPAAARRRRRRGRRRRSAGRAAPRSARCSSTIGPREVLTATPSASSAPSSAAPNRPRVRSLSTRWIESTSLRGQQLAPWTRQLRPGLARALRRQVLAPGDHIHPERPRGRDHRAAEAAEAEQPERRAGEVARQSLPARRRRGSRGPRGDALEQREDQRPGDLDRARHARRLAAPAPIVASARDPGAADAHAALRRYSTSSDGVAHPGRDHQLQVRELLEHLARERGALAHQHQHVEAGERAAGAARAASARRRKRPRRRARPSRRTVGDAVVVVENSDAHGQQVSRLGRRAATAGHTVPARIRRMLRLIGIVISIGLADSLNPSTIAPALLLAAGPAPAQTVAQFTAGVFLVYLLGGALIALGPGRAVLSLVRSPDQTRRAGPRSGRRRRADRRGRAAVALPRAARARSCPTSTPGRPLELAARRDDHGGRAADGVPILRRDRGDRRLRARASCGR